jgi:3-dehydroquinate dehydratase I
MAAHKSRNKDRKSKLGGGPIIVGTVSTLPGMKKLLRSRRIPCSIVEIRLDLIGLNRFPEVLKLLPKLRKKRRPFLPLLVTFRSHAEGGGLRLPDSKRLAYLAIAMRNADLVDIEASPDRWLALFRQVATVPMIVSYHNFKTTPSLQALLKITRRILKDPSVIAKIACRTDTPPQLNRLRELLRKSPKGRVAALGMGELGTLSRFWLPYQGSLMSYGYLDRSAASGQVPAEELAKFFRLNRV